MDEFAPLLARVRRRLAFRAVLGASARVLACWAGVLVLLLGLGRFWPVLPAGPLALAVLGIALAHAARRAWRPGVTDFDAGIYLDRRLHLPELAATAAAVLHDSDAGPFRGALLERARSATAPRAAEVLSWGPPPPAFDWLVGAAVVALALGTLPAARPSAANDRAGDEKASAAGGAGEAADALDPDALLRAQAEELKRAQVDGTAAARTATRLVALEAQAGIQSPDSAAPPGPDAGDLAARIEALQRRLDEGREGGGPDGGGGASASSATADPDGVTPEPPVLQPAEIKREHLMSHPDWPADMDWLVERYFTR